MRIPDLFPPPRLSDHCRNGRHWPICAEVYGGVKCPCECHH